MEQVNDIINNLCEKLGTTIEFIVPEYAKMKITEHLAQIIVCIIVLAILIICLFCVFKLNKKLDEADEYIIDTDILDILFGVTAGVVVIVFLVFVILLTINIPIILKYYNAPYGAFVEEMMRGIK